MFKVRLYRDNGKQNGNYYLRFRVYCLRLYRGCIGTMENKMELPISGLGFTQTSIRR